MVYDTDKPDSLDVLVSLKKDIDKNKDKKEVTIVVIGNRTKEVENNDFESTCSKAASWCSREKIRHFTACVMRRNTLYEPLIYLTSKLNPPSSKGTFSQLSMARKVISKDSG